MARRIQVIFALTIASWLAFAPLLCVFGIVSTHAIEAAEASEHACCESPSSVPAEPVSDEPRDCCLEDGQFIHIKPILVFDFLSHIPLPTCLWVDNALKIESQREIQTPAFVAHVSPLALGVMLLC